MGNHLTTEERAARSREVWARLREEGRAGWSAERRARYRATMALKYPASRPALERRIDELTFERELLLDRLDRLSNQVRDVLFRLRVVERRLPETRRIADGRRRVGRPRRIA